MGIERKRRTGGSKHRVAPNAHGCLKLCNARKYEGDRRPRHRKQDFKLEVARLVGYIKCQGGCNRSRVVPRGNRPEACRVADSHNVHSIHAHGLQLKVSFRPMAFDDTLKVDDRTIPPLWPVEKKADAPEMLQLFRSRRCHFDAYVALT